MSNLRDVSAGSNYTSVDLNSNATTDLYDPSSDATVFGVFLENSGSSAVVQLEVTDGTNTAVLTPGQTAGDGISFHGEVFLGEGDKLQANVTTIEGSSLSETAVVLEAQ